MPFQPMTEKVAEAIIAHFQSIFSEIKIHSESNRYYVDENRTVPLSVWFEIVMIKEDSMGYHRYTNNGRILAEVVRTNALDIVPHPVSKPYFDTIVPTKQMGKHSDNLQNFNINAGNRLTDFPMNFEFLIRGYDPELVQEFRKNEDLGMDSTKQLIPLPTSDLLDSDDWHFSAIVSKEDLLTSKYASFYNEALSQGLIRSFDKDFTIPKYRQSEFSIQLKMKHQFIEKFGNYYADKLNLLFSPAINENSSTIVLSNTNPEKIVSNSLFIQINNFTEYALMEFLQTLKFIEIESFPNTQDQIWGITHLNREVLDELQHEKVIEIYHEDIAACKTFSLAAGFPALYTGRGFLLLLTEDQEVTSEHEELLRFITSNVNSLERDVVQMRIYEKLFNNDKYKLHPCLYDSPIPERIQWLKETAPYREKLQTKLNQLEFKHQIDGSDKIEQFNFNTCLCTTINNPSPLLTLLNKWVAQDLITIETDKDSRTSFFKIKRLWVHILECKNLDKFISAIDEQINKASTPDEFMQKKTPV